MKQVVVTGCKQFVSSFYWYYSQTKKSNFLGAVTLFDNLSLVPKKFDFFVFSNKYQSEYITRSVKTTKHYPTKYEPPHVAYHYGGYAP